MLVCLCLVVSMFVFHIFVSFDPLFNVALLAFAMFNLSLFLSGIILLSLVSYSLFVFCVCLSLLLEHLTSSNLSSFSVMFSFIVLFEGFCSPSPPLLLGHLESSALVFRFCCC